MKRNVKTLMTVMSITATLISFIACGGSTSQEDAQKAQERERVQNLIKTESGFRSYLSGKTFVYDEVPAYGRTWIKITFLDENHVVLYEAYTDERNWGEGEKGCYKIDEKKDDYGRGTGSYSIRPVTEGNFNIPLISKAQGCKLLDWDDYNLTFTRRGQGFGSSAGTFREVEANYIPSQWQ